MASSEVASAPTCEAPTKTTSAGTKTIPPADAEQPGDHPADEAGGDQPPITSDHQVHGDEDEQRGEGEADHVGPHALLQAGAEEDARDRRNPERARACPTSTLP